MIYFALVHFPSLDHNTKNQVFLILFSLSFYFNFGLELFVNLCGSIADFILLKNHGHEKSYHFLPLCFANYITV